MRRIAVIGADTRLGEIVLNRALSAGYAVHAFGRNLDRLAQKYNENLSAFHGELDAGALLEPAVHGARYVVCGLEPTKPLMTALMSRLLPLLKAPPLGRLVFVSQWGAGDSAKQKAEESGRLTRLTAWLHKDMGQDFARAEGLLRVSRFPYVILRPVSLIDDPHAREVVATEPTGKAPPPVARGALAKFILEILTEPGWDRREMTVGAFTDKSDSAVFKRTRVSPGSSGGTPSPFAQKPPAPSPDGSQPIGFDLETTPEPGPDPRVAQPQASAAQLASEPASFEIVEATPGPRAAAVSVRPRQAPTDDEDDLPMGEVLEATPGPRPLPDGTMTESDSGVVSTSQAATAAGEQMLVLDTLGNVVDEPPKKTE